MGGRLKTRGNADSQFFSRSGGAGGKSGWEQCWGKVQVTFTEWFIEMNLNHLCY